MLAVNEKSRHVQVMLQHEAAEFLLCTLGHGNLLQQPLDIDFSSGEDVTFFLNGGGTALLDLFGQLQAFLIWLPWVRLWYCYLQGWDFWNRN